MKNQIESQYRFAVHSVALPEDDVQNDEHHGHHPAQKIGR